MAHHDTLSSVLQLLAPTYVRFQEWSTLLTLFPLKQALGRNPKWPECGTLGNVFDLHSKGLGESNLSCVSANFRQVISCKSYLFFGPQVPRPQNVFKSGFQLYGAMPMYKVDLPVDLSPCVAELFTFGEF